MRYPRNFLFNSIYHQDWYICESKEINKQGTPVILDFYNGDPDVLDRCTFLAHPIPQNYNKLINCKNVVGPVEHPEINGQPLLRPPQLVPDTTPPPPVPPVCIPVCPATASAGTSPATLPTAGVSAVSEGPTIPSKSSFLFHFSLV